MVLGSFENGMQDLYAKNCMHSHFVIIYVFFSLLQSWNQLGMLWLLIDKNVIMQNSSKDMNADPN